MVDDNLIRVLTRLLRVHDELGQRAFDEAAQRALVSIARSVQMEANRRAGIGEPELGEGILTFPARRPTPNEAASTTE